MSRKDEFKSYFHYRWYRSGFQAKIGVIVTELPATAVIPFFLIFIKPSNKLLWAFAITVFAVSMIGRYFGYEEKKLFQKISSMIVGPRKSKNKKWWLKSRRIHSR